MRGIDRYFERYYAKGPRRRPVRVEFCEADVLDVFDEWRRALGITVADVVAAGDRRTAEAPCRHPAATTRSLAGASRAGGRAADVALRAGEDRSPRCDARWRWSARSMSRAPARRPSRRGAADADRTAARARSRSCSMPRVRAVRRADHGSAGRRKPTRNLAPFRGAWRPRRTSSHAAPPWIGSFASAGGLPLVTFE